MTHFARSVAIFDVVVKTARTVEHSLEDFIFYTVSKALEEWKVSIDEIDSVVTGSSDLLDGRAISIMVTSGSVGGYGKDVLNLSSASEHALICQAAKVAAGRSRLGLVVSWGKRSESPVRLLERLSQDPFFGRTIPVGSKEALSLAASAYLARANVTSSDLEEVLNKNRANAAENPRSMLFKRPATIALDSDEISNDYPEGDACVVMLVGESSARPAAERAVRVKGFGMVAASYWGDAAGLGAWPGLGDAAREAYRSASIVRPLKELDFVELSDLTPCHELMAYEALGLAEDGTGAEWFRSGAPQAGGALPVNPSGGLAGGDADFPNGLIRISEATLQLLGRPGGVEVRDARCGLAHATSGVLQQSHSVLVLEGYSQ